MAGWNLKEGICTKDNASDQEFWDAITHMFKNTHKTTTYKFCFLKCLLDCTEKNHIQNISFSILFQRFTEIYWDLIVQYDLCQVYKNSKFNKSKIEVIIERVYTIQGLNKKSSINELQQNIRLDMIKQIEKYCSQNVVGAFYDSTNGLFYSFSKVDKQITFSSHALDFINRFRGPIEEVNYFNWAKMIERINGNDTPQSFIIKMSKLGESSNLNFENTRKYNIEDILPWVFKEGK
ncbi:MAG: hypothetical protein BGN88_12610 [Clostridiales bacterium 43-6]|nr:MAG: hypothetical protein BGN88_12610 [Clostridiales bacterium 43-6]